MFATLINTLLVVYLPFIVSATVDNQPTNPTPTTPDPIVYPLPEHTVLDNGVQSYTNDNVTIQFCGQDCTPRNFGLITDTLSTGETVLNRGDVQIVFCETGKACQYAVKRAPRISVLKSGKSSYRFTTPDNHYVTFTWCADETKCAPNNNTGETHTGVKSTYLMRDMTITVAQKAVSAASAEDDSVDTAIANYIAAVESDGDYLNDWLTHLPQDVQDELLAEYAPVVTPISQ